MPYIYIKVSFLGVINGYFQKKKCKFNANFHLALLSRYPVNTLFAYIY
uniref:Uncharacterized protein n=1 Tax=Siphoviridae sp. ct3fB6 TaxID=2827770 RepID=A0A8S5T7L9_9CAUD|nr:MAG TPA: hypothetical protein [Siphoviridae sp. ct3fB6]